jgi:hypothetical protein
MAHPHKGEAASSSREKFKAITGHSGGGHAHAGASHLKKPGAHGVLKTWSGHHKAHRDEKAHGGKAKARADRFARGGRAEGGSVDLRKKKPHEGKEAYLNDPKGSEEGRSWYSRLANRKEAGKDKSGMSPQDLMGITTGLKRGGKKRADGGSAYRPKKEVSLKGWDEPRRGSASDKSNRSRKSYTPPQYDDWNQDTPGGPLGGANATSEIAAGNKPSSNRRYSPPQYDDWGVHPASSKKYARGGRTASKGKGPRQVTINVVQKPHGDAPAMRPPAAPPPPPAPPPGGAGPPPPPMGAGAPPPGGPGGANPMQALSKLGGGFARGGKATHKSSKGTGPGGGQDTSYDLADWRKYAATERNKRLSGRAGYTQAYTKKIGDDGSLDVQPVKKGRTERADGGRMTAGALSGVGRLEKAEYQKRKHGK